MKLYLGIRQANSHLYLAALNNQGVAVFKTCFPSASLKIATCLEDSNQQPLLKALQREFASVKSFSPSVLYSTDIIPEEPFASPDPYSHPILLAILDSLSE